MSEVKTYTKVNFENEDATFKIAKIEDIYDKRNGKTDAPHRHDYYMIIIINKAKGVHKIDFNNYELANQQVFFIAPGQVHQIIEEERPYGFTIAFSSQFLSENAIKLSFIERLNLFQNYGQSPPLLPNRMQFDAIAGFADSILTLFNSDSKMKFLSIGAYLKLLLIECNNICSLNPLEPDFESSSDNLIRKFKKTVDSQYKKEHSITFYANELSITPDHLTRIIKSKIGKTAKEYIQARIITEAKRLLYFTDLSTKEIGYKLGFDEPANFSAFFKKNTGFSPSHFIRSETNPQNIGFL